MLYTPIKYLKLICVRIRGLIQSLYLDGVKFITSVDVIEVFWRSIGGFAQKVCSDHICRVSGADGMEPNMQQYKAPSGKDEVHGHRFRV